MKHVHLKPATKQVSYNLEAEIQGVWYGLENNLSSIIKKRGCNSRGMASVWRKPRQSSFSSVQLSTNFIARPRIHVRIHDFMTKVWFLQNDILLMLDLKIMNEIICFCWRRIILWEVESEGYIRWHSNQKYAVWMWVTYLWKEDFIDFQTSLIWVL
jgi:hypothetical protein